MKVTHWQPVLTKPDHNIIIMSREEMLLKIGFDILKIVSIGEMDSKDWKAYSKHSVLGISYNTPIYLSYLSTIKNEKEIDYMYCILK